MIFRKVVEIVVFLALAVSVATAVFALDEVNYRALIEKDKVKFGEKVQFLIIINFGTETMAPALTPPSFAQFRVLNENQRTREKGEGRERYKEMKRVWLLEPIETGRLSIASAIITYQDPTSNLLKNGKTDVVFLEVEPTEEYERFKRENVEAGSNTMVANAGGLPLTVIVPLAVGVLVGVIALVVMRKPTSPRINHEDTGLQALQTAITHAEADNLEEYYAALSRSLLDYLQNKFSLDVHVLNTTMLLEKLTEFHIPQKNMLALQEFFEVADKAKFAGYVPDEEKMIELHGTVNDFIEAGRKIKIKQRKAEKKKQADDED
ncbi:hypothetical protein K8S19_12335 [bacterium]|nr:hypothetical protein [bacterium]